jgi:EAL and modified HD-GYP domain-containing signal transduction protein
LLLFYNSQDSEADAALREIALARGRFCELLARQRLSRAECEQAFVTGLLSMVDVLFRLPMAEAVVQLGLPDEIRLALTEQRGKYGHYLAVALACERGDVSQLIEQAHAIGLNPSQVNALHLDTLNWAVDYDSQLQGS